MIAKSTLGNGVRVLTEAMPQVVSSSIGIWVENGSRYEEPAENGVSHFIEHLLFKGTKSRTAAQIAEEIDAVGGILNAFTGKEYTCYYAKILGKDLEMATNLLADIFLNSLFEPAEIDRERQVVLQEISQAEDTPDDFIHDLFALNFWKGHPLALPIFGSVETVNKIDRALLTSFMGERYRAGRVLIAAAGELDHARLTAQCERLFGGIEGNGRLEKIAPPANRSTVVVHEKDLEQAHICIGGPAISHNDPRRYASYLLNAALGGGMSSRLFQEVREKRGRVYSIYSFTSSFIDSGYFGIYAGTNPEWVNEVLEVTVAEINKVVRDGLKPAELDRNKSQLKGNMLLGMESTDSRMNRLARNEIHFRRDVPLEELAAGIDAVTNDQIVELARLWFKADRMAMVLLGNLKTRAPGAEVFAPLG
ncbi:MAG TPA: pitrilysin family protein [Candidatus Binataceae bacterium]|nr:pitrilysin family protein [Candidatus Binataceae bacterium]